jgi:hypothetical protein
MQARFAYFMALLLPIYGHCYIRICHDPERKSTEPEHASLLQNKGRQAWQLNQAKALALVAHVFVNAVAADPRPYMCCARARRPPG